MPFKKKKVLYFNYALFIKWFFNILSGSTNEHNQY